MHGLVDRSVQQLVMEDKVLALFGEHWVVARSVRASP